MAKKILLQCQALTYLYTGLGAIYTKYQDCKEELEIDVLFTRNTETENYIKKIKLSKYIKNVYYISDEKLENIVSKIRKLKNNYEGNILFKKFYYPKAYNVLRSVLPNFDYSDIFFSHEIPTYLITFLKKVSPQTNFVIYGDGSGLLMGKGTKLINPYRKPGKIVFLPEIKPDEIIALAPIIEDDSFDPIEIPVSATCPEILLKLIQNDTKIQESINTYTNSLLDKYSNYPHKTLLLTTRLEDKRFCMNKDDQINIYLDMIEKYCPENSLIILKLHPSTNTNIAKILSEKCTKNCAFEIMPDELKEYPIEIYSKLIQNIGLAITFLSSSRISLSQLYKIKTTDAYEIVQKYPLRYRINPMLKVFQKVLDNYPTWDKKSIIYQCDIIPDLKNFYENYAK